ncbi:MAG TPA: hypothetical protein DCR14_12170 [Acidimicrobiaceae bacterium]|mgnify:CR=1 FL=1|nr:hypothetical protein [Acidimicrobiaceae bacterium]
MHRARHLAALSSIAAALVVGGGGGAVQAAAPAPTCGEPVAIALVHDLAAPTFVSVSGNWSGTVDGVTVQGTFSIESDHVGNQGFHLVVDVATADAVITAVEIVATPLNTDELLPRVSQTLVIDPATPDLDLFLKLPRPDDDSPVSLRLEDVLIHVVYCGEAPATDTSSGGSGSGGRDLPGTGAPRSTGVAAAFAAGVTALGLLALRVARRRDQQALLLASPRVHTPSTGR